MAEGSTAWKAGAAADAVPPAPGGGCSRGQGKGGAGHHPPPPPASRTGGTIVRRWRRPVCASSLGGWRCCALWRVWCGCVLIIINRNNTCESFALPSTSLDPNNADGGKKGRGAPLNIRAIRINGDIVILYNVKTEFVTLTLTLTLTLAHVYYCGAKYFSARTTHIIGDTTYHFF